MTLGEEEGITSNIHLRSDLGPQSENYFEIRVYSMNLSAVLIYLL